MGSNLEYTNEEEERIKSLVDRFVISKNSSVENNSKRIEKKVEKKTLKKAEQKAKSDEDIEDLFGRTEAGNVEIEIDESVPSANKDISNNHVKLTDNNLSDLLFGDDDSEVEAETEKTPVTKKENKEPVLEEPKKKSETKVKDKKEYKDVDLDDFKFDDFAGGMLDD